MSDEDFNELSTDLTGADSAPDPTFRATIRGRRLMLTGWAPWLIRGGPLATLFPDRAADGITIADLTIHGNDDNEVSVRFYTVGGQLEDAESVLIRWAEGVGHRRIWFPDRLVTVESDPRSIGTASVRCPTCRARWSDSSPEFWLVVKGSGTFPRWCPMCGCEVPQWTVRRGMSPRPTDHQSGEWQPASPSRRTRRKS
jgi:hypothetical protein